MYRSIRFSPEYVLKTINMSSTNMSSTNTNTNVSQNMSLYIPHVFMNISDERIKNIFLDQELGVVNQLDKVSKSDKDGKKYNSIYIHFESWFTTTTVARFQEKVLNQTAKLVYDDPWFWSVLENKGKKHSATRRIQIDLQEDQQQEQQQEQQQQQKSTTPQVPFYNPHQIQQQLLHPQYHQPIPTFHQYYYQLPYYQQPPFMNFQNQQQPKPQPRDQEFVSSDYVENLELEQERLLKENIWLKDMVADLETKVTELNDEVYDLKDALMEAVVVINK